jgi:hypothetical protein
MKKKLTDSAAPPPITPLLVLDLILISKDTDFSAECSREEKRGGEKEVGERGDGEEWREIAVGEGENQ